VPAEFGDGLVRSPETVIVGTPQRSDPRGKAAQTLLRVKRLEELLRMNVAEQRLPTMFLQDSNEVPRTSLVWPVETGRESFDVAAAKEDCFVLVFGFMKPGQNCDPAVEIDKVCFDELSLRLSVFWSHAATS
jgi:hypothetical protein